MEKEVRLVPLDEREEVFACTVDGSVTCEHPAWILFDACELFGRDLVDEGENKPKH